MGSSSANWGLWTVSGQSNAGANKLTQAVGRHLAFLEGRCTVMYPAVPFPHRSLPSPACRLLLRSPTLPPGDNCTARTIQCAGPVSPRCSQVPSSKHRGHSSGHRQGFQSICREWTGEASNVNDFLFFLSFAPFPCLAPSIPSFVAPVADRSEERIQRPSAEPGSTPSSSPRWRLEQSSKS